MKVLEGSVCRLVAVQHLRSAHGIKTKNWNKLKAHSSKSTTSKTTKVFAVPLESLPIYNMECGSVPSFLVDACMRLLAHIDTEGLFRKSGSVVRLKALRTKLDLGEECLSAALPCDVASLVKQFFRDLPEPVLPLELQEAFLKAQQLPTEEDRTSATMLLSCVLPERNLSLLRHFFDFLQSVSKRSAENKMDISNLSVILAPNLLHFGESAEKMNANTEKRLKLQAAVIHCFIEHAHDFGVLPQFLEEKVLAMMGCEAGALSPSYVEVEELASNSGMKKRQRRSFGDMVNGALNRLKTNRTPTKAPQTDSLVFSSVTPVIVTPPSKRKIPLESGHSFGFSNKKHKSVKKNLGIDLPPRSLFSGTSTPGSAHSASGFLDSSQITLSSVGRSRRQSATFARRKSRRFSNRHAVHRVESGKAGCFSPNVSKKEAPRKSLRLRFSLGKCHKDAGSESIGWRLATQESTTSFRFTKETELSPSAQRRKTDSKSSKYMSKSEDNLLTPQCESHAHLTSLSRETPEGGPISGGGSFTDTPMNKCLKSSYKSEPAIVISKPSPASILPKKLCCASSAESLESESAFMLAQSQVTPTFVKITKAFTESGSDVQTVLKDASTGATLTQQTNSVLLPPPKAATVQALSVDTEASVVSIQQSPVVKEQNITFCKIDISSLSPLHIDSVIFESCVTCSPKFKVNTSSFCVAPARNHNNLVLCNSEEAEQVNCSRLIDALDIQSPAHFEMGALSGLQSTPCKSFLQLKEQLGTPSVDNAVLVQDKSAHSPENTTQGYNMDQLLPHNSKTKKAGVADHIQHFNRLTLCSPRRSKTHHVRSPLKFQRTPVRQAICRINSLLGNDKKPTKNQECSSSQYTQMGKSMRLESSLSCHPHCFPTQKEAQVEQLNSTCSKKKPVPVPPKKKHTLPYKPATCALGDVTNRVQSKNKTESSLSEPSAAAKPPTQQGAEKDMPHYRGSPRNPLTQRCLMSATKPVNL